MKIKLKSLISSVFLKLKNGHPLKNIVGLSSGGYSGGQFSKIKQKCHDWKRSPKKLWFEIAPKKYHG